MTRKDYVAIAEALATAKRVSDGISTKHAAGVNVAVNYITEVLAADNPRFDRARFLKAAGVQA